jgi:Trk K+ transport system NAD-binding subunit
MKFLASQFAYLLSEREARANIGAFAKYLLFLAALVLVYAVLFHVIKLYAEGEQHSWITGLYWVLVVMSTLGFGDITFTSDLGRLFSIVVLLSGVVFLLVMLPFLFIRLFYAPWLEARVRQRAPREVPAGTRGHVIITTYDPVAAALVQRLKAEGIACVVLEPDPGRAAQLLGDRIPVVTGGSDNRQTYERLETGAAQLLLANCEDTANTNITLTVREVSTTVPIVAFVEEEESIDVLQLSGANHVFALKTQLGEYLANRVDAGPAEAHVVGSYHNLQIAELPARDTPFVGLAVRDTHLRERAGMSIVGFWQRGKLEPAFPNSVISADTVLVVAGTASQMATLSRLLPPGKGEDSAVMIIGAGKVGQAAARALKRKGIHVRAVDRQGDALASLAEYVDEAFGGEAADRRVLERAGIATASTVLLTTNDDAVNIYLAVYCRKLNPKLRIVSRITHEQNVEAIHRAGADFALSYTSLGVEAVMSLLEGHEPVLLGEGVKLFSVDVPASIAGRALRDSGIGSDTGMSVIAVRSGDRIIAPMTVETILPAGSELLLLGSLEQRHKFGEAFEKNAG